MEEADKDWMMIRMVVGWVFLLVPAHPGSPGQRAIKWLLLCCCCGIPYQAKRLALGMCPKCTYFVSNAT